MYTLQGYLDEAGAITIEEFEGIYKEIRMSVDTRDSNFQDIWQELMNACVRYSNYRANWLISDRPFRVKEDSARTSAHDSVISHFHILARYMATKGWNIHWLERLGSDRKRIGDFSSYLVFLYSINAR